MNEMERLPLLIQAIMSQTEQHFKVVVCVNQPDNWWSEAEHLDICEENQMTIRYLESLDDKRIEIIDKSSPGKGWKPKSHGIGAARKLLMDHITKVAAPVDIIISMDADTVFNKDYFASVTENLRLNPAASAVAIPYYHRLSYHSGLDRAMLRYEIYMRCYAINMWRIRSPYCFTALGSAIALPVWAYTAVGGMTPKLSGEDFYFLQKIVKTGRLIHFNSEIVFPATRLSNRVFFGTGPALIKGIEGDWSSYPVYDYALYDMVAETYKTFRALFTKDIETPLDDFMIRKFGELPWQRLRQNFKSQSHFIRACHEKIDGLRILQFLKESQAPDEKVSEAALTRLLLLYKNQFPELISDLNMQIDFSLTSIAELDRIRDVLFEIEMSYRKIHWNDFTGLTTMYN
jgi:cellulose synthase/poly-beta-1,6-N-acetylglucosamine synthase-like glycosyltransferase